MDNTLNEAWRNLQSDRENEFLVQKYLSILRRQKDPWSQKPSLMFVGDGDFFIRKAGAENSNSENIHIDGRIFLLCDSIRKDNNNINIVVEDREYGPILLAGDRDSEREWVNSHYREEISKNKLSNLKFVLFAYDWGSVFTSDEEENDFLSILSSDSNNLSSSNGNFYFLSSRPGNKTFEVSYASFSSPFEEEDRGFQLLDIKEGYSVLKNMDEDANIDQLWDLL